MKKNLVPVAILIAGAAVAGVAYAISPRGEDPVTEIITAIACVMLYVVVYYAIAAAVRSVNPAYRMTVGAFFGFFGYQVLVGLLTSLAALFLVIPAFWIGPKLLLTPYTYAITGGEPDALGTTWGMTDGYYWPTLGFWILFGLAVGIVTLVAEAIAFLPLQYASPVCIIGFPIGAALAAWALHVQALGYVRWTDGLLTQSKTFDAARYELPAETQDR